MSPTPRLTVWNEYQHEKIDPHVASFYPNGIHGAIAQHLHVGTSAIAMSTLW